jgi:hypothetical protein
MPPTDTTDAEERQALIRGVEAFATLLGATGASSDSVQAIKAFSEALRGLSVPTPVEALRQPSAAAPADSTRARDAYAALIASDALAGSMRSVGVVAKHNNNLRRNTGKVYRHSLFGIGTFVVWLVVILFYGMQNPEAWHVWTKIGFDLFPVVILFWILAILAVIPSIRSFSQIGRERAISQFGSSATYRNYLRAGYNQSAHPIRHLFIPSIIAFLMALSLLVLFVFPPHWVPF